MRATLEFELPEEHDEFVLCIQAHALARALDDLANILRNLDKHGDLPECCGEVVSDLREELYRLRPLGSE
jgi:hypothetical protein